MQESWALNHVIVGKPGSCAINHPGFYSFVREFCMPRKKHLRGGGKKEQRQYEHIKKSAQKSGRYGKRAKEVAARTVMKQHKKKGHKAGK